MSATCRYCGPIDTDDVDEHPSSSSHLAMVSLAYDLDAAVYVPQQGGEGKP